MTDDESLSAALRASPLSKELSDAEIETLARDLAFRDLARDEVLVPEGRSDNHLYVTVRGTLGVVKNHGGNGSALLLSLGPGDLVGELSFIDGARHYASLVALAPTRVFALEREKLEALLPTQPFLVYKVMRAIVRTVHEVQRRLSVQAVELANYIYKQHGRY